MHSVVAVMDRLRDDLLIKIAKLGTLTIMAKQFFNPILPKVLR